MLRLLKCWGAQQQPVRTSGAGPAALRLAILSVSANPVDVGLQRLGEPI